MIDSGIFVELQDSRVEGMIPFENMDEPFEVADSRLRCVGLYSGQEYKMGQEVKVRIVRADLSKRQVEMDWIREDVAISGKPHNKGRSQKIYRGRRNRK